MRSTPSAFIERKRQHAVLQQAKDELSMIVPLAFADQHRPHEDAVQNILEVEGRSVLVCSTYDIGGQLKAIRWR